MSNIEKAILGALGGFSAVLVKFLGQDYANVVAQATNLTADQWLSYKIGYGILTPILIFLGGFIAWITEEQKRIKIVALAIAAPALITTWSGGQKVAVSTSTFFDFLNPGIYAQSLDVAKTKFPPENPDDVTEQSTWQHIQSGIGVFFGYNKQPKKYSVIVGSFRDINAALLFAKKINEQDKLLNARIEYNLSSKDLFIVIVGDNVLLRDAKELKNRALRTEIVEEAYIYSQEQQ